MLLPSYDTTNFSRHRWWFEVSKTSMWQQTQSYRNRIMSCSLWSNDDTLRMAPTKEQSVKYGAGAIPFTPQDHTMNFSSRDSKILSSFQHVQNRDRSGGSQGAFWSEYRHLCPVEHFHGSGWRGEPLYLTWNDHSDGLIMANAMAKAIRGHINLEWKSWFFYRKLGVDCARANVALHGFSLCVLIEPFSVLSSKTFAY
jgi:hypothetical protein